MALISSRARSTSGSGSGSRHRNAMTVVKRSARLRVRIGRYLPEAPWMIPMITIEMTRGNQTRAAWPVLTAQSRKKANMALTMRPERKTGALRRWCHESILMVTTLAKVVLLVLLMMVAVILIRMEDDIPQVQTRSFVCSCVSMGLVGDFA